MPLARSIVDNIVGSVGYWGVDIMLQRFILDFFNGQAPSVGTPIGAVTGSLTNGTTTVMGYASDATIADGMSLLSIPTDASYGAVEGLRLATTVAQGAQLSADKCYQDPMLAPYILSAAGSRVDNGDGTYTITDDQTAGYTILQGETVALDYDQQEFTVIWDFKKDPLATSQPEALVRATGGTTAYYSVSIDLTNGATHTRLSDLTCSETLEDIGDFYRLTIRGPANTGNTTLQAYTYAALSNTLGVADVAATGSVTITRPQIKLTIPTWRNDDANGVQINNVTRIEGKQIIDAAGWQCKGIVTNKITARKVNPTDTTNVTKSGDAAAILTVVDDSVELAAAGLDKICTSGMVYKLDNSGGSTNALAICGGVTGNTNPHSIHGYLRTNNSASISLGSSTGIVSTTSTTFKEVLSENITPLATQSLAITAPAGSIVYFILPALIEASYLPDGIPYLDSTGTDVTASVTSDATKLTRPWPRKGGVPITNNFALWTRFIPIASGLTNKYLAGNYTDASNHCELYISSATTVLFSKTVAGVTTSISLPITHVAGTEYEVQAVQAVTGMYARYRSKSTTWGAWSAWASDETAAGQADIISADTFGIGQDGNNTNQFEGNIPFCLVDQGNDPKAICERQGALY